MSLNITIHDVAREAGVSIKTVSRVMNREPNVSAVTRDKVMAVADRLNYRPNVSARSLAGLKSYLLALVFDNPSPSYDFESQLGAIESCRQAGYYLLVEPVSIKDGTVLSSVQRLISTVKVDGVILTPPVCDLPEVLDALDAAGIAHVRIAPDRYRERGPYVMMDDFAAAEDLTAAIIEQGHKRIGFVQGPLAHGCAPLRDAGYRQAMDNHGLKIEPAFVVRGDFSFRSGITAGEAILADPNNRPTAIFASSDDMALGVMMAASRLGLKVPEDLSVLGFDDTPMARSVWPQLSTVAQPIRAMAATAADLLISGQAREALQKQEALYRELDYALVMRGSSREI